MLEVGRTYKTNSGSDAVIRCRRGDPGNIVYFDVRVYEKGYPPTTYAYGPTGLFGDYNGDGKSRIQRLDLVLDDHGDLGIES